VLDAVSFASENGCPFSVFWLGGDIPFLLVHTLFASLALRDGAFGASHGMEHTMSIGIFTKKGKDLHRS